MFTNIHALVGIGRWDSPSPVRDHFGKKIKIYAVSNRIKF